jgi:hypothetical protein
MAELLHVQYQGSDLMLWALCNVDQEELQERKIRLACTGEELELHQPNLRFISTVFTGAYVFHIFEDLG